LRSSILDLAVADYLLRNMAVNWGEQNTIFKKQGRWTNFEVYVNDDWKINNRLTLNLSIRYSYLPWPYQDNDQFMVFNPFKLGFGPRLCVAWDPTARGKWAIRAGFGQFYNRDDIFVTRRDRRREPAVRGRLQFEEWPFPG
jgi:hypothetical protein